MGSMVTLGMAALSGISAFAGAEAGRAQQQAQARSMAARAEATRRQAQRADMKGRMEAEQIDAQKSRLRQQYNDIAGRNRANLGAGNVSAASGSPLDVAEGNINSLAQELGDNALNVKLKQWETKEQTNALKYQADVFDSQSSYLKRTAGNIGASLLTGLAASARPGVIFRGLRPWGSFRMKLPQGRVSGRPPRGASATCWRVRRRCGRAFGL